MSVNEAIGAVEFVALRLMQANRCVDAGTLQGAAEELWKFVNGRSKEPVGGRADFYDAVARSVRELMLRRDVRYLELCQAAGVSGTALDHVLKGDRRTEAWVLCRIARALGVGVERLFEGVG